MTVTNCSIAGTNKSGKRGKLWCVPMATLNPFDIILLVATEATKLLYNILIQVEK